MKEITLGELLKQVYDEEEGSKPMQPVHTVLMLRTNSVSAEWEQRLRSERGNMNVARADFLMEKAVQYLIAQTGRQQIVLQVTETDYGYIVYYAKDAE